MAGFVRCGKERRNIGRRGVIVLAGTGWLGVLKKESDGDEVTDVNYGNDTPVPDSYGVGLPIISIASLRSSAGVPMSWIRLERQSFFANGGSASKRQARRRIWSFWFSNKVSKRSPVLAFPTRSTARYASI